MHDHGTTAGGGRADQTTTQPAHSVSQSVCQSVSQSVSQSVTVSQTVSQSVAVRAWTGQEKPVPGRPGTKKIRVPGQRDKSGTTKFVPGRPGTN